ncbi:DUF6359 domain-containing protein [Metabacillus iocasae]|uniref:Extracellular nuclease n=1 Tax=Priestia iocasae TaxID=2291674 RepID=A0ABS2QSR6_9BACI|nr:DUF6359 domain-containing protein [Metabacillus iocasae]MBM7702508.1 putative extracellular nuclease [Metabacillus iocasae]
MRKRANNKLFSLIVIFTFMVSLFTPAVSQANTVKTVSEAIANNTGTATVEGYIIGFTKGAKSYQFEGPFSSSQATNIAIADKPDEKDPANILPVQLPSGNIRTALNLVENPELLGQKVQITGALEAYFTVPGLKSPTAYELIDDTTVKAVVASRAPGAVEEGAKIELSTETEGAIIYYTVDGSEPNVESAAYTEPLVIKQDTTVKAIAVKDGLTASEVKTFYYMVQKESLRIHDIQGVKHASPYDGQNVANVEGIITKIVDSHNFFMQDQQPDGDDRTSEAILVYKRSHGMQVGDVVKVDGQVKEWVLSGYSDKLQTDLAMTEINATMIQKEGTGDLPEPIIIGKEGRKQPTGVIDNDQFAEFDPEEDGIDFFESLEGMRVQLNSPDIVAPQKYGELAVVVDNGDASKERTSAGGLKLTETNYNPERIFIEMGNRDYVAKAGDKLNGEVIGVVSYGYSNYKVLVDEKDLPELMEGTTQREVTTIEPKEDELTVATYNMENFSANPNNTSDEKVAKIAQSMVSDLKAPDIIGLVEVQDNNGQTDDGTTDASESYKRLVDAIVAAGGPAYQFTDIAPEDKKDGGAPGGNIRVGFLYNPERVSLVEGQKGTATEAVSFADGELTMNPGRIAPDKFVNTRKPLAGQFTFQGEEIIVIAAHLNSKGGDQPLYGKNQPPVLGSEEQRVQLATEINSFVKDVKAQDPNMNVVVVGDMNDFEFSNPLRVLKGDELTNMVEKVEEKDRYSYIYQGNSQVLDHILVSNHLAEKTTIDMLHLNAAFMEEHGRASDHDPVIVQLKLKESEEAGEQEVIYLNNVKINKLIINKNDKVYEIGKNTVIKKGILVKKSTSLRGKGLKHTSVKIKPNEKDAIINFNGEKVEELIIANNHVKEIKGAENIKHITLKKKVDISKIKFTNSKGESIDSPFFYR